MDIEGLDTLRGDHGGALLEPTDEGYDAARRIWNAMIDKRPAVIARCSGVADVVAALRFARARGLAVAVRGGGHNIAGSALCDGGLLIDLSRMRAVHVDPQRKIARAQGGATWRDYDRETQLFGLASTGGAISSTGIAGLTLGGGFGWLSRSYGLACDELISAQVVTVDGRVVTASADANPDLFLGAARRRRQLRHRHLLRVSAPSGRRRRLRAAPGHAREEQRTLPNSSSRQFPGFTSR